MKIPVFKTHALCAQISKFDRRKSVKQQIMGKRNARQVRRKRARELRAKEQAFGLAAKTPQNIVDEDLVETDAPKLLEQVAKC